MTDHRKRSLLKLAALAAAASALVACGKKDEPAPTPAPAPAPVAAAVAESVHDRSRLNPELRFDNFVTGKANQLARAAAVKIKEQG